MNNTQFDHANHSQGVAGDRPPVIQAGPRTYLGKATARLDQAVRFLCAILLFSIFVVQIVIVLLRYMFAAGFVELQNFVSYGFAAFCILVVPLALATNEHVRVDVLSAALGPRYLRRADVMAILFCLMPVFVLAFWYALPIVSYSWSILEGSRDTGGLPGYFVVLTALPLSCLHMIVSGLSIVFDRGILHSATLDAARED